ncbi:type I polyketide synthase [Streptomyces johnsoniae]|uniref:SDR family NAD(P)-dependent oxidoreductase n=1 Tax=Streptomyces johnsoniae TaxID=3075532 RepID=A0ABU2S0N0_9ACTN|nr:SDR family NAD(P)-dependent oxidoreductase [Streptomyces sp. DSM 41886]MDT0442558.1 SDR family NAD(P)-dependent oxidoreductase [Streptomyces sp. DSM 41886]
MSNPQEPIAIVGIGLRLPGGNDTPDGFAEFLRTGQSGVRPLPTDRWDAEALHSNDPDAQGTIRSAQGGFLDDLDQFDAKFFNISPKEADYIDPQQRLTLEVAWEALEDAGIDPGPLRHGGGGVYIAVSNMDYAGEMADYSPEELNSYMPTGAALSAVSGRLSYFLGWRGPCITVDTACSASLVALHLAAQGLRAGETDLALCGGVNTIVSPRPYILASQGKMLSPDGQCKTFDDAANGYCRAEGAAVIALKRLSDAVAAGDRVYALVRGSAIGQDGESSSLMVPNGTAQEGLLRAALASAGLEPDDISYIEAHGTGTPLGDPIEIGAISNVFRVSRTPDNPVPVGSLKTNIGHMESAAGIGGVIKTALQLREARIYPHLNFNTPSRHIPWETSPVTVPTTCRPWPGGTRRALVNSFGLTGTLATVVLEQAPEAPAAPAPPHEDTAHVFTLSAKSAPALRGQIRRYQQLLRERPGTSTADLCYTANTARADFALRLAGTARTNDDIARLLDRGLTRATRAGRGSATAPKVAFLFSGGGSQYVGMGRPWYRQFPEFRRYLDDCDRLLAPHLGRSVRDMLLGDTDDAELIHRIDYMQPALFALEYAVGMTWLSWGVRPSVLAGHSIGEIAACTIAGLFTLDDATTLMAARGRLMHASPPGAMSAVEATTAQVGPFLDRFDDVSLAAVNGTRQLVLSGATDSLAQVEAELAEREIRTRRIAVSCASHSPLMAEAAEALTEVVASLTFHEPQFAIVSNLTGAVADPAELATPAYWGRHLRGAVRFADGMRAIADRGRHAFLEAGPAGDLTGMGKQCLDGDADHLWLNSLHPDDADGTVARQTLAALYTTGVPVDWAGHHAGREGHRVDLPTYAFDRRRHWLPTPAGGGKGAGSGTAADAHPLLGRETTTEEERTRGTRTFSSAVSATRPGYLTDHKVMGKVVFPGAGYVEMLLALQDAVHGETSLELADVGIHEALFLPEDDSAVTLRTELTPRPDGAADIRITSLVHDADDADDARDTAGGGPGAASIERTHVTAVLRAPALPGTENGLAAEELLRKAARDASAPLSRRTADELYADFADLGVDYGPSFRGLRVSEAHPGLLALGELAGPEAMPGSYLPPTVLDCAFQSMAGLAGPDDGVAMPVGFARCRFVKKPRGTTLRSVLRLHPPAPDEAGESGPTADLLLLDGDRTVFVLQGLTLRRVAGAAPDRDRMYSEVRWVKRAARPEAAEPRQVLAIGARTPDLAALSDLAKTGEVTVIPVAEPADAAPLLNESVTDVAWFWQQAGTADESLRDECERNFRSLLALRDVLEATASGSARRLWLVTEGAQVLPGDPPPGPGEPLRAPAAATLWGFGHVMWTEYPAQRVTLVDLPPGGTAAAYAPLLEEWPAAEATEFQIAYRAGLRHVRRVFAGLGDPAGDVELVVREHGRFSGVAAVPLPESDPDPEGSAIQVRVHAAGVSHYDVFNVLGLSRRVAEEAGADPDAVPLGQQCAGVVTAAGPGAMYRPGDRVMIVHPGALRGRITVDSAHAVRVPDGLTLPEAAALPGAFLPAHRALHLAAVRPGDTVLVHATPDGTGHAAAQLALRAGAEVLAVTGGPAPGQPDLPPGTRLIEAPGLDFAEQVREATGGHGADLVIESFTREFTEAALAVAAPGARFAGLGRDSALGREEIHAARPDLTYLDRSQESEEQALRLAHDTLGELAGQLAEGLLSAVPVTAYTLDETEEAFAAVSRGTGTAATALLFRTDDGPAPPPARISPRETYLITGGLGALGRLAAERLVGQGARHLVVAGRTRPDDADLTAFRARLGPGVDLAVLTGDVGDPDDVARFAAALHARTAPLGGIVHAAGVLADAPVASQTWESIDTVFGAKVYGSWLLHEASLSFPTLRFFIGYSSVTSVLGSRGQANYAAGNAFLDTLLCRRHAAGLPGLSVNWGAWGEIGLAAAMDEQHIANIEHQGFRFFAATSGMRALFRLLERPRPQAAIAEVDWDRCASTRPQPNALYERVARPQRGARVEVDLEALLAQPRAERRDSVVGVVQRIIADQLHFEDADDVPPEARFFEIGLDSLAAVELKNALELCFRVPLSTAATFDHPSVSALAEFVEGLLSAPEEDER